MLAEEAISRGHDCIFIGEISDLDWVSIRIMNLGFSRILEVADGFQTNPTTDLLIIDSYLIPPVSQILSNDNWLFTLSISDEISPSYLVNAELRPSLEILERKESNRLILSGPDYILTRVGISKSTRHESDSEKLRVLVVGGGADPFGFVRAITKVITDLALDVEIHCFTNDDLTKCGIASITIHEIGPELDSWAEKADVVFTTASTTSLEFIAREVPVAVVCAVDNQSGYYEQLGRLGYAAQVGVLNSTGEWKFDLDEIQILLTQPESRKSLRESVRGLIDLKGAARVIDVLETEATNRKVN